MSDTRYNPTMMFLPVLGLAYMLSQFLRSSPAVVAPELMQDLALSSADIGFISGLFFFVFAMVQLPVGVFLDRVGPRCVMGSLVILAGLGSFVFAAAEDFMGLGIGRSLMGIGCAAMLMGCYVVFAQWFPKDRFASYAATIQTIGNMGVLLATLPLAAAVSWIGWRASFTSMGAYALLISLLLFVFLKDRGPSDESEDAGRESILASFAGFHLIARDRALWPMMPLLLVGYGTVASMTTLWNGPYLADVHGLEAIERGQVLLAMGVGAVLGPMFLGHLDRIFDTRKGVVVAGTIVRFSLFGSLAFLGDIGTVPAIAILVAIAVSIGYASVMMAHARSLFHDHLVGRGMAIVNTLVMGGVAGVQFVSGLVVDHVMRLTGDVEQAYRAVFAFMALLLVMALLVYLRSDDCKPSSQRDQIVPPPA